MKIEYFLVIIIAMFIPQIVLAEPSADISTNADSIEKGNAAVANVTLTNVAAWNIKIVGSGAASCSNKEADVTPDAKNATKKITLSCTSTEEGIITFTVTGDITDASGETKDISLTKNVNVTKNNTVTINPGTGFLAEKIMWIVGILVIGYAFWYYKRLNLNKM